MKLKQFRYAADNLGYVFYGHTSAIAIDGGAVEEILSFVKKRALVLKFVTNTHGHRDHTVGTRDLADRSRAEYLDHQKFSPDGRIELDGETITVIPTPGHTTDAVTFAADGCLVTGDTLFNGTVGNCFSGDLKSFYQSIRTLAGFPENTVIYAGHDYVEYAMAFARSIEPENVDIQRYLKNYEPGLVRSTLADEFKVNPYLRFNEPSMIKRIRKNGFAVETEFERWQGVMSMG